MGCGIALTFALAGVQVRLTARREKTLARARIRIAESLGSMVLNDLSTREAADEALGRIETTRSLEGAVRGAGLVVESIPEDLAAKKAVLRASEDATEPGTVLATDTSSLSIEELASALLRPEDFGGFHWFNPPELVDLVEIVSGPRTSEVTVERLLDWAVAVGKAPIHVRHDVAGFVANRLQYALLREAFALAESGVCSYQEIDAAVRTGLGARWAAVGPFESLDLAGLDVHEAVARRLYPELANGVEPAQIVTKLVADGALGCKTGRGLHGVYDQRTESQLLDRRARVLVALSRLRG